MQTRRFPTGPDARSPAGAEVRHLIEGETGGMIHSTVPAGQVNRAAVHATVSEFWHVLSGRGQLWRREDNHEETVDLSKGVTIDIPVRDVVPVPLHRHRAPAIPLHHDATVAG